MFEYMVIVKKDTPTVLTNTLDWELSLSRLINIPILWYNIIGY